MAQDHVFSKEERMCCDSCDESGDTVTSAHYAQIYASHGNETRRIKSVQFINYVGLDIHNGCEKTVMVNIFTIPLTYIQFSETIIKQLSIKFICEKKNTR
eukprot:233699_1